VAGISCRVLRGNRGDVAGKGDILCGLTNEQDGGRVEREGRRVFLWVFLDPDRFDGYM
jgi:hypothetical protein